MSWAGAQLDGVSVGQNKSHYFKAIDIISNLADFGKSEEKILSWLYFVLISFQGGILKMTNIT